MMPIPEVFGPIQTERWAIEQVPSADAMAPWRRCWEILRRAVERFPNVENPWTSDSLLHEVMLGNCQLWVAWSYADRRIEGAVITRFVNRPDYAPNDKIMEIPLVAGNRFSEWGSGMMGLLYAGAAAEGCTYLGGAARKGWIRMFGFQEVGRTPEGVSILAMPVRRVQWAA